MKPEDIPKKQMYRVPEGYFEELPSKIQGRLNKDHRYSIGREWMTLLRLSLPAILLIVVAYVVWHEKPSTAPVSVSLVSTEALLSEVSDGALIDYLLENGISTEEIIEVSDLSMEHINGHGSELELLPEWNGKDDDELLEVYSEYL